MSMESKAPLSSAECSVLGRAGFQAPPAFICLWPLKTPGKRPLVMWVPLTPRLGEKGRRGKPWSAHPPCPALPTTPNNPEQHGTHGTCQPSPSDLPPAQDESNRAHNKLIH